MYSAPDAAPASQLAETRRGKEIGRFCKVCGSFYPKNRARHSGKPIYGKDHVASPCSHEGDAFEAGEAWWEPAVEVLPKPPEADSGEGDEASA